MAFTREEAKSKLVALGIAEPTEEQITSFLNDVHNESAKEKERAERLKAEADRAKELEKELETLKNQNLTDAERQEKELKDAKDEIAELKRQNTLSEVKAIFGSAGLTEEEYNGYLHAFAGQDAENAKTMANSLVSSIKNMKESVEKKVKEEILDQTKGGGGGNPPEKTEAEKIAETIGQNVKGINKASNDIIDAYTK